MLCESALELRLRSALSSAQILAVYRMLRDFGREEFFRKRLAAVAHIHRPSEKGDDRNHHAHILVATRTVGPDGWGEKFITQDNYGPQLKQWREKWAALGARYLENAGHKLDADRWRNGHLDLERQRQAAIERGDLAQAETLKDRKATKHRGPAVDAMERKGRTTERGNIYRDVVAANTSRAVNATLKLELAQLQKLIAQEERAWADRLHKVAIEKEKIKRRFVEPTPARAEPQRGTLAGGPQEKQRNPFVPAAPTPAQWSGLRVNPAATTKHVPELSIARADREMTEAEGPRTKPDQLHGPAAQIWTAYNVRSWQREYERTDATGITEKVQDSIQLKARRDPFAFSAALDSQGFVLARVTKEEAERSAKEAAHWKQHGETRPVYQPGQFVAVTPRAEIYALNRRTTGEDAPRVQAFLEKTDWKGALPGIDRAREIVKDREAQRQTERQTIRAEIDAGRLKRATAPAGPDRKGREATPAAPNLAKAAKRTIGGAIGAIGKLADGFSLGGLTPKEKHEAAKLRHANQRQAEETFDTMADITAQAKALEQEQQREIEARQQRDRDRDRR